MLLKQKKQLALLKYWYKITFICFYAM